MVQRIDPEVAAAAMREAGWEPLVPYPGAGEKWRCRCAECGEIREPRYSHLKRGTGCGVCAGNVPYSNERATEIMREHGLHPLTPYPGSANAPWPSRCIAEGHEVSPRFHQVNRRGHGCRECARLASRLDAAEAETFMRANGWTPQEPYPGSNTKWSCVCQQCGETRTPTYQAVRQGHGCGACAGNGALDPRVAEARLLAAGARPLAPFQTTFAKWKSECLECRQVIYPRLNQVTQGHGVCGYCAGTMRFNDEEAAAMLREAGFEPLVSYPGSSKRWKARCMGCRTVRHPTLNAIRSRGVGCGRCNGRARLLHEEAAEVVRAAGFEPVEPYPGAGDPWPMRCIGCERVVSPSYSNIARGTSGCMACRLSLSLPGRSAGIYVMVHDELDAVKIGIGVVRDGLFPRVRAHAQRGWVEVSRWVGFDDVRVVSGVERMVLQRWRGEGIAGFVGRSMMPQGGWSETASLSRVNVEDLVGMVTVALGDVAAGLPEMTSMLAEQAGSAA